MKFIHNRSRAISYDIPRLVLYLLLLALPCCLKNDEVGAFHFAKIWLLTGMVSAIFPATGLWLLSCRYGWTRVPIAAVLWVFFALDFWLFFQFGARISDRIVYFVLQTDHREASEFLTTYLPSMPTAITAIIVVLTAGAYWLIVKCFGALTVAPRTRKRLVVGLAIANAVSAVVLCVGTFTYKWQNQLSSNTLQGLYIACRDVASYRADVSRLEAAMSLADSEIDTSIYPDATRVPDVVFIIGESYNPNHCPLYGYPLMTTPAIAIAHERGDLVYFPDVVTPSSSTGRMMEVLYSPADASAGADRWDVPLVPGLFKHAGYAVALHDNQCTRIVGDSKWNMGNAQFLNSAKVEALNFDYRNTDILPEDMPFCIRELRRDCELRDTIERPLFSIYHLMGQHSPAEARYPQSFARFGVDDYKWRKDITERQATEIAHYDNATFYNDSVMSVIFRSLAGRDAIAIYVSDHGEEVHDYRNQYGRTLEPITPGIARNVYRVPLFIYTTPEFRASHVAVYQAIVDALSHKVYTGDVGQLLLYLGGIRSRWRDDDRNPLLPLK